MTTSYWISHIKHDHMVLNNIHESELNWFNVFQQRQVYIDAAAKQDNWLKCTVM